MAAIEKGTKLTDNPKDYMLRVRLDSETLKNLDAVCEHENKSRSEVVRDEIKEKYQKLKKTASGQLVAWHLQFIHIISIKDMTKSNYSIFFMEYQ